MLLVAVVIPSTTFACLHQERHRENLHTAQEALLLELGRGLHGGRRAGAQRVLDGAEPAALRLVVPHAGLDDGRGQHVAPVPSLDHDREEDRTPGGRDSDVKGVSTALPIAEL